MNKTLTMEGLDALFDIEFADDNTASGPVFDVGQIVCHKCKGRGNFIGYTGKVVGKCFACDGTGIAKTALTDKPDGEAIDVAKIAAAIATAFANGKKTPKLHLDSFLFSRAPNHGKNPGAIYVKEGEQYLGKILAGRFHAVRECSDDQKLRIVAAAADPLKSAIAYGFKTIRCACCGIELTNGESRARGIGPICAEKYGW